MFYTFKLFSNNCRGNSIDTYVACDTFSAGKYKGIPYLDVSTVYSKENGSVIINVVNRHKDKAISTEIIDQSGNFSDKAQVNEVNANDLNEAFSFDKQHIQKLEFLPIQQIHELRDSGSRLFTPTFLRVLSFYESRIQ